jgi:ABC-type glycerol-3-phosphate transport system permease component
MNHAIPAAASPRPAVGRLTRRRIRTTAWNALFYFGVAAAVLIALFPFYWIIRTSLESNSQLAAGVGGANGIIPAHLSATAYTTEFSQGHFQTALIVIISIPIALLVLLAQRRIVSGLTAGSFR